MDQRSIVGVLLALAIPCVHEITFAHGGVYRPPPSYGGPGDTVPPQPVGRPQAPRGPVAGPPIPRGAATAAPHSGAQPRGVSTGADPGTDGSSWESWWSFNKDRYLDLKSAVHRGVVSGSDEFFLAPHGTHGAHLVRDILAPSEDSIRSKVVPALERALQRERKNDIVTGALVALAKLGDPRDRDACTRLESIFASFLSDPNQEIAETAACALGILASESSIALLTSLLNDEPAGRERVRSNEVPQRTRAFAAFGLGLVGQRTQVEDARRVIARALVGVLREPDHPTADVEVAALVALGMVPVRIEPAAASGRSRELARELSRGSSREPWHSRQGQIEFVVKCFRTRHAGAQVRGHAPAVLARLVAGCPDELRTSTARLMVEALATHSTERAEVQQGCALALGQIGDCDDDEIDVAIRTTLVRAVEDGDQQSRSFALMSLGQVGSRRGSGAGAEAGAKVTREFLLTTLTKGRVRLRPWAALAIAVMERAILDGGGAQSAVAKAELRAALADCGNPSDLGAYAVALGICKDAEAEASLLAKLDQVSDARARGYVAVALGLIDARGAIEPIRAIVKASKYNAELIQQAAIGLGLLGDKSLVPELITMLHEARSLASQGAVASALGFIGDSRSIDPLVKFLEDPARTARARGLAAVALGIAADRRPLPWNHVIGANLNYRASTPTLTSEDSTGILDIL